MRNKKAGFNNRMENFTKGFLMGLREDSTLPFVVCYYLWSLKGKRAFRYLKVLLYIRLHDGGFVSYNSTTFSKELKISVDKIKDILNFLEQEGLIILTHQTKINNRITIQYASKEAMIERYENVFKFLKSDPLQDGNEFSQLKNLYLKFHKRIITSEAFTTAFMSKYFKIFSDNLFKTNINRRVAKLINTIPNFKHLSDLEQKKIVGQFKKEVGAESNVIISQIKANNRKGSARINYIKHAKTIEDFLIDLEKHLNALYPTCPLSGIAALNHRCKSTAENWMNQAIDPDFSFQQGIKVTYVINQDIDEYYLQNLLNETLDKTGKDLYGRVYKQGKQIHISMPTYYEFNEITALNEEGLEENMIAVRKIKVTK
jgi:hypothetical protein